MRSVLMQDWTTVSGSLTQDDARWLDVRAYQDVTCWVECASISGTPSLSIQTSPTYDDSLFVNVAPQLQLSASSTPVLLQSVPSPTTAPLAKLLRWQISGGTATFRIRASLSRQRFFTPPQLSNCILWTRSDLGISPGSGGVQTWADQSGAGLNFTAGVPGTPPPLQTVSGFPAIQGNTTGTHTAYYMETANVSLPTSLTMFVVAAHTGSSSEVNRRILETSYATGYYLGTSYTNGPPLNYQLIVGDTNPNFGNAITGPVSGNIDILAATYAAGPGASAGTGTIDLNGGAGVSDSTHFPNPSTTAVPLFRNAIGISKCELLGRLRIRSHPLRSRAGAERDGVGHALSRRPLRGPRTVGDADCLRDSRDDVGRR